VRVSVGFEVIFKAFFEVLSREYEGVRMELEKMIWCLFYNDMVYFMTQDRD
jgi:hypothetical protein